MTKVINIKSGEKYDVYIGRPSEFGNPFTHIKNRETKAEFVVSSRKEAIEKYKEYLLNNPELLGKIEQLRGKTLGCWCINSSEYIQGQTPLKCHGQIIQVILDYPDRLQLFSQNKLF